MPYMLSRQTEWLTKQCEDLPPSSNFSSDYTVPILLNICESTPHEATPTESHPFGIPLL